MGISLKIKFSNYLLVAVLQAMLAVCNVDKFESKTFKLLIGAVLQAMLAVCRSIKYKKQHVVRGKI